MLKQTREIELGYIYLVEYYYYYKLVVSKVNEPVLSYLGNGNVKRERSNKLKDCFDLVRFGSGGMISYGLPERPLICLKQQLERK